MCQKDYDQCITAFSEHHNLGLKGVIQWLSIILIIPSCGTLQVYDASYVFRDEDELRTTSTEIDNGWFYTTEALQDQNGELGSNYDESKCKCRDNSERNYSTCYNDDVKCKVFPRKLHFTFLVLKITDTAIVNLRPGDLADSNSHLKTFVLFDNDYFESIESGAFDGMTALRNLFIHKNVRFTHLEPDSFKGLVNLNILSMLANSLVFFSDIVPALHPKSVPNLREIRLRKIDVINITQSNFGTVMVLPLEILSMTFNNLWYIDPNVLIPLTALKVICVDENRIVFKNLVALINKIVERDRPIENLSISRMGFTSVDLMSHLLERIGFTRITHLTLSNNYIERIEKFPQMPNIKFLNMNSLSSVYINDDAFAKLACLETLLLNKNSLFTVPTAVNLRNLVNLDISENTENAFFLPSKSFSNMYSLIYLNMSMNSISELLNETFVGLQNLRVLDLESSKIFSADNGTFAELRNLQFLRLKNNVFPSRYMYPDIYKGLVSLQVLILSKCSIKEIKEDQNIFTEMPNLQHLLLDDNGLAWLAPYLFQHLTKLITLDVSYNKIVTWDQRILPTSNNLEIITASHNLFRRLSRSMVEDFSKLKTLDVRFNGYVCTCEEIGTQPSLINKKVYDLLRAMPPFCDYPDELKNTSVLDYIENITLNNYCDKKLLSNENTVVLIVVPAGVLLFLICSTLIIFYIFRWHVRYWLFILRMGLSGSHSLKSSFSCKKAYRYDAFVSYCNEDRDFVIRLVAMLENYDWPLKLCVYERDFQIGTVISESILASVADSRRILLVISEAYIESQWCRWEVQVAENHRLFFEDEYGRCVNDTLVMVKLGDISQTRISPMLRYLMKTRIYIKWDPEPTVEGELWKKLRKCLKPPGGVVKHNLFT